MSSFEESVKYVLENEGGYSNDPSDPGGATNFGITIDDLARFRGHEVIPQDVKLMTIEEAKEIYKEFYWDPLNCGKIDNDSSATCIFDTGVLYGIRTSAKYAQRVVGVDPDGQIGPLSLNAVNKLSGFKLVNGIYSLIVDHIDALVDANHRLAKFQAGWMNRARRLLTLV